jgi:hypothetical protein
MKYSGLKRRPVPILERGGKGLIDQPGGGTGDIEREALDMEVNV